MSKDIENLKKIIEFFRKNWDIWRLEIFPEKKIELTNEEFENLFGKEPIDVSLNEGITKDLTIEYYQYYEGENEKGEYVFSDIEVYYRIEDGKIIIVEIKMERGLEYE